MTQLEYVHKMWGELTEVTCASVGEPMFIKVLRGERFGDGDGEDVLLLYIPDEPDVPGFDGVITMIKLSDIEAAMAASPSIAEAS